MFCSDCGTETADQTSFCPACGHDLTLQRAQREQSTRFDETISSVNGAPRAGFWRRFAAHAIDVLVVWLAVELVWDYVTGFFVPWGYRPIEGYGVLAYYFFTTPLVSQSLISTVWWSQVDRWYYDSRWLSYFGTASLIPLAAILAYYVIGTARWGRTLGKAALGIRVVGPDGVPPGIGRALARETLGKFLSLIFWVGFVLVAGNQKRGLHDRISGTEVEVTGWNWMERETRTREEAR